MKAEQVVVEQLREGRVRITVPDNDTDSLVVFEIFHFGVSGKLYAKTLMRGNCSGGRIPGKGWLIRRAVESTMSMLAPKLEEGEFQRRMEFAKGYEQEMERIHGQG